MLGQAAQMLDGVSSIHKTVLNWIGVVTVVDLPNLKREVA